MASQASALISNPEPRLGTIRPCARSEYEPGTDGWVIEQFTYTNAPDPMWVIPAWEERGYPDLADVFPTSGEAWAAIRANTEAA